MIASPVHWSTPKLPRLLCFKLKRLPSILAVAATFTLGGCSDGGGVDKVTPELAETEVQGYAVKGMLNNASVSLYTLDLSADDLKDELLDTGTTSNTGEINGLILPTTFQKGPFLIEVTGGREQNDSTPVIPTLRTLVRANQLVGDGQTSIVATPLTTIVLELARITAVEKNSNTPSSDDVTLDNFYRTDGEDEISPAVQLLKLRLGLGLLDGINVFTSVPLITDTTDAQEALAHRTVIETNAALFKQFLDAAAASPDSADSLFTAFAQDLSDGDIDGTIAGTPLSAFSGIDIDELVEIFSQRTSALMALTIPGTDSTPISSLNAVMALEGDLISGGSGTPAPTALNITNPTLIGPDSDGDKTVDAVDTFPNNEDEQYDTDGDCASALGYLSADYLTSTAGNGCGDNSDAAPENPDVQNACQTDGADPDTPAADAGVDTPIDDPITFANVSVDRTITLNGSNSCDPNFDSITYSWAVISVPQKPSGGDLLGTGITKANLLTNPNTANPSFEANFAGEYTFELTVSDGTNSSTDTVVKIIDKGYYIDIGGNLLYTSGLVGLFLLTIPARRRKKIRSES